MASKLTNTLASLAAGLSLAAPAVAVQINSEGGHLGSVSHAVDSSVPDLENGAGARVALISTGDEAIQTSNDAGAEAFLSLFAPPQNEPGDSSVKDWAVYE